MGMTPREKVPLGVSHRLEQLPPSILHQFFSSSTTSSTLGLRGCGATRSTPARFSPEHLRFTSGAAASSPGWGTVCDNIHGGGDDNEARLNCTRWQGASGAGRSGPWAGQPPRRLRAPTTSNRKEGLHVQRYIDVGLTSIWWEIRTGESSPGGTAARDRPGRDVVLFLVVRRCLRFWSMAPWRRRLGCVLRVSFCDLVGRFES